MKTVPNTAPKSLSETSRRNHVAPRLIDELENAICQALALNTLLRTEFAHPNEAGGPGEKVTLGLAELSDQTFKRLEKASYELSNYCDCASEFDKQFEGEIQAN